MKNSANLIADIRAEAELTRAMTGRAELSPAVIDAMRRVPREQFVPVEAMAYAFDNGPLRIGCGQTISQPYIVALMTDLLEPQPGDRVLEIGTGSGYQAAVLSLLVRQVDTVEIIPELAASATERLQRLGFDNVSVRLGDGGHGWPERAPFDKIILTAAAPEVPQPLLEQLKPGGRLVLPVGPPHGYQELQLVIKAADGAITADTVLSVAFVPLTGDLARPNEFRHA
jgi:protein-L-isoaspartate(D-aspartate) O-methyltransferase